MNRFNPVSPPVALVLFYPGKSLAGQLSAWTAARDDFVLIPSRAQSASGIRRALDRAKLVIVDAGEDAASARDAFAHAVAQLGASSVVVYTETMHEGLELLVRGQGGLFLLGPMNAAQWGGLLQQRLGVPVGRQRLIDPCRRSAVQGRGKACNSHHVRVKSHSALYRRNLGAKAR